MVEIFPQIKYDIVVAGGGPAGISAAIFAARSGLRVAIVEKNSCLGKKLCITGKGRCNITNDCGRDEFFANIPENPRFMYSSYHSFSNFDLIDLMEELGVKTVVERGGRVFPSSGRAADVRDSLRDELKRLGVKIYYGCKVTDIIIKSGRAAGLKLSENAMTVYGDAVVIATGGLSYPGTGSTGDGLVLAEKLGHKITPLLPALVGIETKEEFVSEIAGLTLKNCGIRFLEKNPENGSYKSFYEDFGEILFTHTGLSGPTVLSGSFFLPGREKSGVRIVIDLKPALDNEKLDQRLLRDFAGFSKRKFENALSKLLPSSLIPVFVKRTGIDPGKPVSEITKSERGRIVDLLKNFDLEFKALRPISEAIVTKGGVDVKDIDPGTMGSKIIKGLYFAGEMISVTGFTGGFNLTIAFSTGCLAGKSSAAYVKNINLQEF